MCRQSWPLVNRCRQSDSDSEWILPTLFSVKFIDKGLDKCQCTAPNPMQKVTSHFYMHILSVSSRHYHGAALTFTVANCWVAFERFPFLFFLLLLVLLISHCLIKASASNLSSTRFVGRFFSSTPLPHGSALVLGETCSGVVLEQRPSRLAADLSWTSLRTQ